MFWRSAGEEQHLSENLPRPAAHVHSHLLWQLLLTKPYSQTRTHTHRHTNPPKLSQVEICYFKYAIFCKNCIDPVALFLKLYTNHMYPLISHHTEFRYRMYSRQTSLRSPQKETFTSVELHTVGDLTRR